jgi:large subunit ribosomal protein L4
MKSPLYNQKGEKVGDIELPENVFNQKLNPDHLYQSVLYYQNSERQSIAKTKDRSEVRGGGRKPWRQKGTGRARHGSIRSPLWKGGGVTFGPSPEKKYQTKFSKKAKKEALKMALSQKIKDKEIIFLDQIKVDEPKTKLAEKIIQSLEKVFPDIEKKKTLIILNQKEEKILKAFRNLKNIQVCLANSLNAYFLLKNKYAIIERDAISRICTNH